MNENEVLEGEVIEAGAVNGALAQIVKAEIDQQIATAHQYPRSIANFKKRALEMATMDEETAESCIYARPVGGGKVAEGMSIRMAEIVAASFGNLRVGATLIEMTPRYVKARGFAHDLETNFASTSEVIESTVDKNGKPFAERMRVVVAKAALAKARRDATFSVVPRALCKPIETAARQVAVGDATTFEKRRGAVMAWVGKLGIDVARVFAALQVKGEADIGLDHLVTLTGLKTSIKDGETSVDDAFPPIVGEGVQTPAQTAAAAAAARAKEKAKEKPAGDAAEKKNPPPNVDKATGEVLSESQGGPTYPELRKRAEKAASDDDYAQLTSDAAHLPKEQQTELAAIAAKAVKAKDKF